MTSSIIRGRILLGGKITHSTVVIADGKIASIRSSIRSNVNHIEGSVLDLGADEILVPAAVDLAAHYRDWGQALKETVQTGTRGALAGGITTVCDMPNTVPRLNTVENIQRRVGWFQENSYADFAIHAMPPIDPSEVEGFKAAGAFAIHLFPWDLPDWNFPRDLDPLPAKIKRYVELGLQGSIHVEEQSFRETPYEVEGERFALGPILNRLHPEFKVRLRMSLADSVERVNAAKEKLPHIMTQTSPHYLLVSAQQARRKIGVACLGAPLLGDDDNLVKMQELLSQGAFDICVSDHFPHRLLDKFDDTRKVLGELLPKRGFTSIDFAYPLLLSRAGLAEGCRLFAENPARVLGIQKGKIAAVYAADLVVLKEGRWQVDPDLFESKGKVTPLAAEPMQYRVMKTFMRGTQVFDFETRNFTKIPVKKIA
jgi:dihydroorotase